jgi:Mg-chelatase subunit ChlI
MTMTGPLEHPAPLVDFDLDSYEPIPTVHELRAAILRKVRNGEDPLPLIQGRNETKRDVLTSLLSGHNVYLVSEEGTGKTRLAQSLASLLSTIPKIRGCAYNDDPKWPDSLLCPNHRGTQDPANAFGIELLPGHKRFSRIQGNDYTDEAKLLGLKDIQAIVGGKSPSDPKVFTATGAFRANRGILFVDELPAIRTKVQVLLHPILDEKKVILEEYNWEHPLDIVVIATGNPQGFSHVNEVPRPLLDRMELVYMPLPNKEVERNIMLQERFQARDNHFEAEEVPDAPVCHTVQRMMERDVIVPWWMLYLLNEAVAYSRKCGMLDKTPSLRGSSRALDHTCASAELGGRQVARLKDASDGLRLALRGRMELRADLLDFDNPELTFQRTDEVANDLLWNGLEDFADLILGDSDRERLSKELRAICAEGKENISNRLGNYPELSKTVECMKQKAAEKVSSEFLTKQEAKVFSDSSRVSKQILDEYNYSAIETVVNAALHRYLVTWADIGDAIFVPTMVTWGT